MHVQDEWRALLATFMAEKRRCQAESQIAGARAEAAAQAVTQVENTAAHALSLKQVELDAMQRQRDEARRKVNDLEVRGWRGGAGPCHARVCAHTDGACMHATAMHYTAERLHAHARGVLAGLWAGQGLRQLHALHGMRGAACELHAVHGDAHGAGQDGGAGSWQEAELCGGQHAASFHRQAALRLPACLPPDFDWPAALLLDGDGTRGRAAWQPGS